MKDETSRRQKPINPLQQSNRQGQSLAHTRYSMPEHHMRAAALFLVSCAFRVDATKIANIDDTNSTSTIRHVNFLMLFSLIALAGLLYGSYLLFYQEIEIQRIQREEEAKYNRSFTYSAHWRPIKFIVVGVVPTVLAFLYVARTYIYIDIDPYDGL